jgi:hypothetical protein
MSSFMDVIERMSSTYQFIEQEAGWLIIVLPMGSIPPLNGGY